MKPKHLNMTVGELIEDLSMYPKSAEIQLCTGPSDDQMLAVLSIYGDNDDDDSSTTVFIDLGEYLA